MGNHHHLKKSANFSLTSTADGSEASNALEFAVVKPSKLQCLLTVDHIEKPSLSLRTMDVRVSWKFFNQTPTKRNWWNIIYQRAYHSKFQETCAQIPTLHVSLVSKQIFSRRNNAYIKGVKSLVFFS